VVKVATENATDLAKRGIPLVMGAALVWLLWHKSQTLDWALVGEAFYAIPAWRWIAAALATVASFWAIAQYDVVAHRHFQTGIPDRPARMAGASAIAVGQTTGFGPVVGAALRWRLMPAMGHGHVLRITGFVTLCFFVSWGLIVLSFSLPVLAGIGWIAPFAFALGLGALCLALLRFPKMAPLGRRIDLPSLRAMVQLVMLAATDLVFAGLALHLLLPPEMAVPLFPLIAAFTLALGAGMVGGTPGGVGPFELALVAILHEVNANGLAAALIGFRLVYYAIPCLLGAFYAFVATPVRKRQKRAKTSDVFRGSRAEHPIAAQNTTVPIVGLRAQGCAMQSSQSLTLFLGATDGALRDLVRDLQRQALARNRLPCMYKLNGRDASTMRSLGWAVHPFAVDAIIDTQSFTLEGSERRQLRRALRKADKAGIKVGPLTTPKWSELETIHHAWEAPHGQERGFTMGRFCPHYLEDKPLYGAWYKGRLIAYASAVVGDNGMALDLMRHYPELPPGTMHRLIHCMIEDACEKGIKELSLAALPHPSLPPKLADCAGLTRFKTCFAPRWKPLYIAAPNHLSLLAAAYDIRQTILSPEPLEMDTVNLWHSDSLLEQNSPSQNAKLTEAG
jgi:phosphatidylglycerol lysyltransferase